MVAKTPGTNLGGQMPVTSGITGSTRVGTGTPNSQYLAATPGVGPTGYDNTGLGYMGGAATTTGTTMMSPAIQTIWSKEILFQAMPVLRFEQFAVKKTELGVMPGLVVNFMRYNNLPVPDGPLVEGIRMKTHAITAQQYSITVAEQGFAVAVSELLLNASFDDIMASASRLLGRNMALYMDTQARATLQRASSVVFGRMMDQGLNQAYGIYGAGTPSPNGIFHPHSVKDAVEVLASKNVPRLGETYVCFAHPHQTRALRDTPEWIEVTKYASPGNFMLGEIGRMNDVVFIETTQITKPTSAATPSAPTANTWLGADFLQAWNAAGTPAYTNAGAEAADSGNKNVRNVGITNGTVHLFNGTVVGAAPTAGTLGEGGVLITVTGTPPRTDTTKVVVGGALVEMDPLTAVDTVPLILNTPAWGEAWVSSDGTYEALMLGDNAFGHAVSLPVELRDGGVLDFGREHALAWYSIWGWGLVTESAVVKIQTK